MFIRHRTADEIKEAESVKVETLRDPEKDEDRVKKPEWLIMIGMKLYAHADLAIDVIYRCLHTSRMCAHW